MIDTMLGAARLFDFIRDQPLPAASLLELTGDSSKARSKWRSRSGLEMRVAAAWEKPLDQITCGECRMLVGQRFGLRWLAPAVATFVARFPHAECDLYPGDLSINALTAWQEMHEHAPSEAAQMFNADFRWLVDELAGSPDDTLLINASNGLRDARRHVRLQADAKPI